MFKKVSVFSDVLILYAFFYLPQILTPYDTQIQDLWQTSGYHFSSWLFLLLQISALFLFAFKKNPISTPGDLGFQYKIFLPDLFLLFGILTVMTLAVEWFSVTVSGGWELQTTSTPRLQLSEVSTLSSMIVVTVLLSSFAEELFFRSFLMLRLSQMGISQRISPFISALFFSLPHRYEGMEGLTISFFSGLILSFWFIRKKNILTLWAAHALFNLLMLGLNSMI